MPAEIETMAYAGETPWHKLGTRVDQAMTSAEAAELGGVNWTVAKGKLLGGAPGKQGVVVPGWFSTYRVEDNKPLSVVGPAYTPIQNREMADFMDSLVQDDVLRYETVGSLKGGLIVFFLAQLKEAGFSINGDEHITYLLGMNRHDHLMSMRCFPTFVRVVCNNTLEMALSDAGKNMAQGIRIRHVGDIPSKMDEARKVLKVATRSQRRLQDWLNQAAQTDVTEENIVAVRDEIIGTLDEETPAIRQTAIAKFMEIYTEEANRVGASAYALVNAVTGYADHGSKGGAKPKSADARFESSLILGALKTMKEVGIAALCETTGLPQLSGID